MVQQKLVIIENNSIFNNKHSQRALTCINNSNITSNERLNLKSHPTTVLRLIHIIFLRSKINLLFNFTLLYI